MRINAVLRVCGGIVYNECMIHKRITIEDLAGMVSRGFSDVTKRFDGVDKRFEGVDKRFDKVDVRLGVIESDVSYLKDRVTGIGRTLDRHEELLEEHSNDLKWIRARIEKLTDHKSENRAISVKEFIVLETRVRTLEQKIALKIH